jgi:5-methylcytosine-specific restriction enzyme B
VHDTLAAWQFAHEMKVGDHVIAKEGRSKLLGWGVVTSDYRYVTSRSEFQNVRDVEWRLKGRWNVPEDRWITNKTLTDFTEYKQWLYQAFRLMRGEDASPEIRPPTADGYSLEQAMDGLFIAPEQVAHIVDLLGRKMNVILQGPPGVGKTFIARRIAYRLMDEEDASRVQLVQFHQAYAYEDFVQGFRPTAHGTFELKNGIFYDFCRRAGQDLDRKYVFIIDEINRGNLPRILGELMVLIEGDKRSSTYAMPLTYSTTAEEPFFVPENVFLLGMMNTADRSLAMVDYALRRRFGFVTLKAEFENERFSAHLVEAGVSEDLVRRINERMAWLNQQIAADQKNLGPGFEIGHSYFVPTDQDASLDEAWYTWVIRTEVEPMLREYWFDQPKRVEEYIQKLIC